MNKHVIHKGMGKAQKLKINVIKKLTNQIKDELLVTSD